jgi:signal transduction histidine kinase
MLNRGVGVVFAILAACLAVSLTAPQTADTVGPLGMAIGYAAATAIMWRRSSALSHRARLAWRFVAGGLGLIFTGILIVGLLDTLSPAGAPAFGFADAFFLAAYVMLLIGLGLMPQMSGKLNRRFRLLVDAFIGGVSVGVILWMFEIRDLIDANPAAPVSHRIIASAYPIVDLAAIVVVTIVLVRRSEFRFDPRLMLFAAAASLQAVADITYLKAIGRSFEESQPLFPLMLLAVIAFVGAATLVQQQPRPREYADRGVSLVWMMAPYGAAALMVGLLMFEVARGSFTANTKLLLFGTLIVGALVIVRQSVSIRENRELVEAQRGALVSSVSHELRTPLTAMVGFLDLLDDPEVGPTLSEDEKAELISTVHSQTTYLSRIVHDLVMLARGNLDLLELERDWLNVASLVRSSVASSDEGRKEIVIDVEDGIFAFVDADRIQQIVVNLLSNATRYGGDQVLVAARSEGATLHLEVHDNGPGVPKKYELTIWERFERGPNRLNATMPGSGIGLAIVRAIARGHGGSATCTQSEPLGGACFTITIPNSVSHTPPIAEPSPPLHSVS